MRWIGHGREAGTGHLEDAQLAHGAEAILDGAHDPVRMGVLALEVERFARVAAGNTMLHTCEPELEGRIVLNNSSRGEQDQTMPPFGAEMAFRMIWPSAPIVMLPHAGHFLQEDAPEAAVALIEGFVQTTG